MRVLGLSVLVALRVSSANESALVKCAASDSSPDEVTLLQGARRVDFHQAVAEKSEEEVASEEKEAESEELSSYRRRRRNGDAHCRRRRACSHWAPDGPVDGYVKTDSSSAIYWEKDGRKHYVGRCNQCPDSDACSSYLFVSNSHMDALPSGQAFDCSMLRAPGYIKTDSSDAIYWQQDGRKHHVGRCNQCPDSDACSSYRFVSNSNIDALPSGQAFDCSMLRAPVTHPSQCTGGGYLTGDGTGGHESSIGTANSPEQCLTMVRDQCPDANGATISRRGDGPCYCEFGMTGVDSARRNWQSCRFH